jgi:CrcB protein
VTFVVLCLAGAAGAVARFLVDGAIRARLRSSFPWATLAINVTGSLLLGVLTGIALFQHTGADAQLIAGTGFCGGYTTFSTAMFESVRLLHQRSWTKLLGTWLGTVVLSMGAAAFGLAVTR